MVSQDPTSSFSQTTVKRDYCMHRVIADDELWKEFKAKLESSGAITNAKTQQILQEFILKEQQKRKAAESAETAEEVATPTPTDQGSTSPSQREGLVGMVRNLSGGALKSLKALEQEITDGDESDDEGDRDIDGPNEEWGDIVDLPRKNQPRLSILGLDSRRRSSAMSIASSALSAACSAAAAGDFDDYEYGEEPEDQIIAGDSLVKQLERRLSMAASGQTAFGRRRSSAASIHSNYSQPRRSSSIASGGGGASVSSIYETSARNNLAALAAKRAINTIGSDDDTDALHHDHQDGNRSPPTTEGSADTPRARDLFERAQSYAGHGVKRLSMSAATIRRQSLASEIEHRPSHASRGSRRSSVFALAAEEVPEEDDES